MFYACMAVAAWLVWRQQGMGAARIPLALFGIQLVLNVACCWLFFGFQSPGLAAIDVFLLLAAIVVTRIAFWRRSVIAGLLLVPYLAWVGLASAMNVVIWWMNALVAS